jgi:hypothetical protein
MKPTHRYDTKAYPDYYIHQAGNKGNNKITELRTILPRSEIVETRDSTVSDQTLG